MCPLSVQGSLPHFITWLLCTSSWKPIGLYFIVVFFNIFVCTLLRLRTNHFLVSAFMRDPISSVRTDGLIYDTSYTGISPPVAQPLAAVSGRYTPPPPPSHHHLHPDPSPYLESVGNDWLDFQGFLKRGDTQRSHLRRVSFIVWYT